MQHCLCDNILAGLTETLERQKNERTDSEMPECKRAWMWFYFGCLVRSRSGKPEVVVGVESVLHSVANHVILWRFTRRIENLLLDRSAMRWPASFKWTCYGIGGPPLILPIANCTT